MARGKKTGGGSRKGVPNKRTQELAERVQGICGDPVEQMAQLAQQELTALADPKTVQELIAVAQGERGDKVYEQVDELLKKVSANREFALAALKEVSQYVHAKRKAVEHSGEGGGSITFEMVLPE